jgi:hypothetical protein
MFARPFRLMSFRPENEKIAVIKIFVGTFYVGLIRTVVSMLHCGCSDRSSILRLDTEVFCSDTLPYQ